MTLPHVINKQFQMDLNVKRKDKLLEDNIENYLDFEVLPGQEKDTTDLYHKGRVDKFTLRIGTCIHQKTPEKQ